jgi:hypothetical protein
MAPTAAPEPEIRVCITCGESKPVEEMALRSGRPRNQCKKCKNAHQRAWVAQNPERAARITDRARKWRRNNPDRTAEYTRRKSAKPGFREEKREYMRGYYANLDTSEKRDRHYRRRYGISLAEYDEILLAQCGVCAICAEPPTDDEPLVVDHCHDSGQVRGLLCSTCNLAIGYLKDSPDYMLAAAAYILRYTNLFDRAH